MRTLVLGGTGMLGRAVVAEARSRSLAVLGLSHGQADVRDLDRLRYWADSFRPELIVNCAAYTKVDLAEGEAKDLAFAVNGEAVGNVTAVARESGARLIHVSTDYVFDGMVDPRRPYREDDPTGPLSVYGHSKLDGERRALSWERSQVVRASWLFGPGGPNFAATIVRLIEGGKLPLRIIADQIGCPTYTPFLAKALLDLAPLDQFGVFHYCNREPASWYAFASEIAGLWSGTSRTHEVEPITTAEYPLPAPRPAWSVLDVTRFEQAVGRRVEPWGWGLVDYLAGLRKGRT